ncbi:MAG: spermidine/putrescine ABC transporter substrate-binding protein [Oscillospiraceae bacterium]|nr:spermidine/putrescine ABC transporter substrate-binding protein [Oscillospiraceae bacterium]
MKRFLALFLAVLTLLLAGCSKEPVTVLTPEEAGLDPELFSDYDYSKLKDEGITLNVANWGEYLSINEPDMLDVNKAFEAITGITVNYKTYASNETLYSKLRSGGASYDVIFPSDYMLSKMIEEDLLQKLDYDNIPNLKNINPTFLNPEYDPENEYSVPYLWGMVCIIYNTAMVDEEITGWSSLWDEKYAGNILMFNNPRDAFGIALTYLGYSMNTENVAELEHASVILQEQKEIVQGYVMDEIFDKMEGGSAAIAPYYAGDALIMIEDNPDLTYCVPEEGTNQFVDAMCIPVTAKNKEAAEMYINFLCEAEVAYLNCDYTGYSTPNSAAFELLDEEVQNNPLSYPSDEYLMNNTEVFINLSPETNELTQTLWNQLKIGQSNPWFVPLFLLALIAATVLVNVLRARKKKRDSF